MRPSTLGLGPISALALVLVALGGCTSTTITHSTKTTLELTRGVPPPYIAVVSVSNDTSGNPIVLLKVTERDSSIHTFMMNGDGDVSKITIFILSKDGVSKTVTYDLIDHDLLELNGSDVVQIAVGDVGADITSGDVKMVNFACRFWVKNTSGADGWTTASYTIIR